MNARLSINTDSSYSSFLVELNQRYYTMSFDMPTSSDALFAETVTPADLGRYITGLELESVCADFTSFVPGRKLEDDGNPYRPPRT